MNIIYAELIRLIYINNYELNNIMIRRSIMNELMIIVRKMLWLGNIDRQVYLEIVVKLINFVHYQK